MAREEFLDDPMPDIIEQWRYYFSVLAPQAGELILDVGCNTGDAKRLLLREYPLIGKVIGLEHDPKRYDDALSTWRKDGSPAQMNNLDIFKSEWNFTRKLTLELLESLTDAELSQPPGGDLGPFWKQFRHVGRLQECYVEALTTKAISFDYANKRYKGGCSKDALKTYLHELDRELLQVIEQMDWKMAINWDAENVGVLQHLMRMASHEILHHGQWILYARLLGIKLPPSWKAWGV